MVRRGRASSAVEQDPPRHVLETFILVWLDGSTSMEERQLLDSLSFEVAFGARVEVSRPPRREWFQRMKGEGLLD